MSEERWKNHEAAAVECVTTPGTTTAQALGVIGCILVDIGRALERSKDMQEMTLEEEEEDDTQ